MQNKLGVIIISKFSAECQSKMFFKTNYFDLHLLDSKKV